MKLLLFLTLALAAFSASAGYNSASKIICKNEELKLVIERRGDLFGRDHLSLKENSLFGATLLDEDYRRNWAPEGKTELEQMAIRLLGATSSDRNYLDLMESPKAVAVVTYKQSLFAAAANVRDVVLVQERQSGEVIKFDIETECTKSEALF
jgi:hypothetical protein